MLSGFDCIFDKHEQYSGAKNRAIQEVDANLGHLFIIVDSSQPSVFAEGQSSLRGK